MSPRVLLVEPNPAIAVGLLHVGRALTELDYQINFETARPRLTGSQFDFVFANLRLGEFNGLHLVHLAADVDPTPRCIVYTDSPDLVLAREVQRAGAFYDTAECLQVTFAAYIKGRLPRTDRRDPTSFDRRRVFRGGRRCWDQHVSQVGPLAGSSRL